MFSESFLEISLSQILTHIVYISLLQVDVSLSRCLFLQMSRCLLIQMSFSQRLFSTEYIFSYSSTFFFESAGCRGPDKFFQSATLFVPAPEYFRWRGCDVARLRRHKLRTHARQQRSILSSSLMAPVAFELCEELGNNAPASSLPFPPPPPKGPAGPSAILSSLADTDRTKKVQLLIRVRGMDSPT